MSFEWGLDVGFSLAAGRDLDTRGQLSEREFRGAAARQRGGCGIEKGRRLTIFGLQQMEMG